jgi:hypothetical protein
MRLHQRLQLVLRARRSAPRATRKPRRRAGFCCCNFIRQAECSASGFLLPSLCFLQL